MKAVGLLSGGLDSTLAAKVLIEQGIEVHAVNFTSPFCTCTPKSASCASVVQAVKELGDIPLKRMTLGDEFLLRVREPRHGHGKGMNPCIDCRIMKIQKAVEHMKEIGASFLFTGEVLGQRPMSQHKRALTLIERESGIQGYILRPLSASLLEPTEPEKRGWVDRDRLLSLSGRNRKPQIQMAYTMGISDYPCPAGGCLLTDKSFSTRLKDYFQYTASPKCSDVALLKVGRHFRLQSGEKVIVARDAMEGDRLIHLASLEHNILEPVGFSGPVVLFEGDCLEQAIEMLVQFTNKEIPSSAVIVHKNGNKRKPIPIDATGNAMLFESKRI
ncbi:hypothetical protein QA601_11485 [Chitinispirillales bacterium ANBcel5]|nr:hypothetical protein [Chitinispirillales bacterium ANBcel5]